MACRKNCCRFLRIPSATQEQVPVARLPSTHCHTACRNAGMPSAMLGGDKLMTSFTQLLSRPVKWGEKKWRQDDFTIAQKVSRASKRNKTSQNHTSLLQELDCCRFVPKDDFDQLFNFQGPVISECTIVISSSIILIFRFDELLLLLFF